MRIPITTTHLQLRAFIPQDYDFLRRLDADERVLRYRSRGDINEQMTLDFLEKSISVWDDLPQMVFPFAIVRAGSSLPVGQIGLTRLPEDDFGAFAWYSLLPEFWGQGIASEALKALIHFGFEEVGLFQITAECHPSNLASERVMQKSGMVKQPPCGRSGINPDGQKYEYICYAIQREAYAKSGPAL